MEIAVFCALGLLIVILLGVGLRTRIRYRIGSRHVKVVLLGLTIRRIPLLDIESISKRRGPGLAERWLSTMRPKHRLLVIRRHRGLFRNVMITPKNRYVFRADLERAMKRVGNPTAGADADADVASEEGESSDTAPRTARDQ